RNALHGLPAQAQRRYHRLAIVLDLGLLRQSLRLACSDHRRAQDDHDPVAGMRSGAVRSGRTLPAQPLGLLLVELVGNVTDHRCVRHYVQHRCSGFGPEDDFEVRARGAIDQLTVDREVGPGPSIFGFGPSIFGLAQSTLLSGYSMIPSAPAETSRGIRSRTTFSAITTSIDSQSFS